MDGFGAALTDSATYLLANLKSENQSLYDSTMDFIFNNRTGLSVSYVSFVTVVS